MVDALCGGGDDYYFIYERRSVSATGRGEGGGGGQTSASSTVSQATRRATHVLGVTAGVLIIFSAHMIRVYFVLIDIIIRSGRQYASFYPTIIFAVQDKPLLLFQY